MFTPTAEKLVPDLPARGAGRPRPRLWREGYNDHLAGHITVNLGDGTLLCNPWLLTWAELRPSQVLRIDLDGNVVEGDWPVPLGIPLHLELHKLQPDVGWAVHNHPAVRDGLGRHGRDAAHLGPELVARRGRARAGERVRGARSTTRHGAPAVEQMGGAAMALLAGHGVFVLGARPRRAPAGRGPRAAVPPRLARAGRRGLEGLPVPQTFLDVMARSNGEGFLGFWERPSGPSCGPTRTCSTKGSVPLPRRRR